MTHAELLDAIQSRAARVAVGASAVRGRGNSGTVTAARKFFAELDLATFGVTPGRFHRVLDRETQRLLDSLPKQARHWGLARKLLNIFLRDCFYTGELNQAYGLHRAEKALEIPLDSITARALKKTQPRGSLPQWPGVRHLTVGVSEVFQQAALVEARRHKITRVHLDAILWSQARDGE